MTIPRRLPEDESGGPAPENKPRLPFAVGDWVNWGGLRVQIDALVTYCELPRYLVRDNGVRFYLVRDADITPWKEVEVDPEAT